MTFGYCYKAFLLSSKPTVNVTSFGNINTKTCNPFDQIFFSPGKFIGVQWAINKRHVTKHSNSVQPVQVTFVGLRQSTGRGPF